MRTKSSSKLVTMAAMFFWLFVGFGVEKAVAGNLLPKVKLSWATFRPEIQFRPDFLPSFEQLNRLKFKAEATDADGWISQVEFFANGSSIAVLTNPPFNIIWTLPTGRWDVYAVATDNNGATNRSGKLTAFGRLGGGRPRESFLDLVEPVAGELFATTEAITVSVEMFSGLTLAGPVEFMIDGQSVGQAGEGALYTVTAPPVSMVVSNLTEGVHVLGFDYLGTPPCANCYVVTNAIRVVRLGIRNTARYAGGNVSFEVATSYTGREHVVERSLDLAEWTPVSTNYPSSSAYHFVDSSPAPASVRKYYRVVIASPCVD